MYEFGDGIILEGNGLPWLIWIQLLVLFLLLLLLYHFGIFAFNSSGTAADSPIISSSSSSHLGLFFIQDKTTGQESNQVGGNETTAQERDTTSTSDKLERDQSISEGDEPSMMNVLPRCMRTQFNHPCHFLELAGRAFLGCLGLGSTSMNPPRSQEREE